MPPIQHFIKSNRKVFGRQVILVAKTLATDNSPNVDVKFDLHMELMNMPLRLHAPPLYKGVAATAIANTGCFSLLPRRQTEPRYRATLASTNRRSTEWSRVEGEGRKRDEDGERKRTTFPRIENALAKGPSSSSSLCSVPPRFSFYRLLSLSLDESSFSAIRARMPVGEEGRRRLRKENFGTELGKIWTRVKGLLLYRVEHETFGCFYFFGSVFSCV